MTASLPCLDMTLSFTLPYLNIENILGGITLREDSVVFWALRNSPCRAHRRKKHLGIERNLSLLFPSRFR